MTKILPLDKHVVLDKRYINTTDKITEDALEKVIDNQSGGGDTQGSVGGVIVWRGVNGETPVGELDTDYCATIEECAEKSGFTVEELQAIFDGRVSCIVDIHDWGLASKYLTYYESYSDDPYVALGYMPYLYSNNTFPNENASSFYFERDTNPDNGRGFLMRRDLGNDDIGYRAPLLEDDKKTTINAQSTDDGIPTAKAVYDFVMGLLQNP